MALNDIILRSSSHSPLTTKGSELTYGELDGNFIELYDYLIAMNSDSGIAPYDNTATYNGTEYVSYNGNIYVHISATSTTQSSSPQHPRQKIGNRRHVPSLLNPHSPLRLDLLKAKSLP